jgi:hypothetical protein
MAIILAAIIAAIATILSTLITARNEKTEIILKESETSTPSEEASDKNYLDWRTYFNQTETVEDYIKIIRNIDGLKEYKYQSNACFENKGKTFSVCVNPTRENEWLVQLVFQKGLKTEYEDNINRIDNELRLIRAEIQDFCNCYAKTYRDRNKDIMVNIFESKVQGSYETIYLIILEFYKDEINKKYY